MQAHSERRISSRVESEIESNEGSSGSLLVNEHGQYADNKEHQSLSRPKGESSSLGLDKHRERSLVGSLTNSYKFKPDGMMKKVPGYSPSSVYMASAELLFPRPFL